MGLVLKLQFELPMRLELELLPGLDPGLELELEPELERVEGHSISQGFPSALSALPL